MEVVYFLLPVAVLMSATGLGFFIWALRNGQYEDLEGPRWRVVYDDDSMPLPPKGRTPAPPEGGIKPAEERAS